MTGELSLGVRGRPGRRRTVSANAWIARRREGGPWHSHVYAGSGKVHVLSARTMDANKALEFNLCHLKQVIVKATPSSASSEKQLDLEIRH